MTRFDERKLDLRRVNLITKYPSIPTYHCMGEKGRLLEELQVPFFEPLVVTEKIDGTNARIILVHGTTADRFLIGSREELLYASGDLLANPQMGIVECLRPLGETLLASELWSGTDGIFVIHAEVYGGKIGAGAKNHAYPVPCHGRSAGNSAWLEPDGALGPSSASAGARRP